MISPRSQIPFFKLHKPAHTVTNIMPTVLTRLADAQTSTEVLEVLNTISTPNMGEDSISFHAQSSGASVTSGFAAVNNAVVF